MTSRFRGFSATEFFSLIFLQIRSSEGYYLKAVPLAENCTPILMNVGTTMSRQTKILYAQHAPFISKSPGEYALFWSDVESTKRASGLVLMLLVKDGATWKVTWLNDGS